MKNSRHLLSFVGYCYFPVPVINILWKEPQSTTIRLMKYRG